MEKFNIKIICYSQIKSVLKKKCFQSKFKNGKAARMSEGVIPKRGTVDFFRTGRRSNFFTTVVKTSEENNNIRCWFHREKIVNVR